MNIAQKIHYKIEKILSKLKALKIIQNFELVINFYDVEESMSQNLKVINSALKKCLKKIISKPKKAEIRNVITELVRKKNLNYTSDHSFDELKNSKIDSCSEYEEVGQKKMQSSSFQCFKDDVNMSNLISEKFKKKYLEMKKKSMFLCEKCGKLYKDIEKRLTNEMNRNPLSFQCNLCSSGFIEPKLENLTHRATESHRDNHSNLSQIKCRNPGSHRSFGCNSETFKPSSKNHSSTCQIEEMQGKKVITQKTLSPKKRIITDSKPPFTCNFCGKVFTIKKSLKKHMSLKHSNTTAQFKCSTCQKIFFEKAKLNRHMRSHFTDHKYECSKCLKRFVRSDTLKRHISLAHDNVREHVCAFCQKKFSLKYNRDVHEVNVHKTTSNWFQCELCGQKFKTKITLKSHMEIHLIKRISCSFCNKVFSKKIQYKRHMRNHYFGVSPYQTLMDSVTREEMDE